MEGGRSGLIIAADDGEHRMVSLLLRARADPCQTDSFGRFDNDVT